MTLTLIIIGYLFWTLIIECDEFNHKYKQVENKIREEYIYTSKTKV